MKTYLLILSLCAGVVVQGQNESKSAHTLLNKFSIAVNYSPDYDYRVLKDLSFNNGNSGIIQELNTVGEASPGFTTGMKISYSFCDKLSLETGVQYSRKGYQTKTQALFSIDPPDIVMPIQVKQFYNYTSIDIPLVLHYTTGDKKLKFISGLGISANMYSGVDWLFRYTYADGHQEDVVPETFAAIPYEKLTFSPQVSAGVLYQFNHCLSLRAEPVFRYGLFHTEDADNAIQTRLWNAGIDVSFYLGL